MGLLFQCDLQMVDSPTQTRAYIPEDAATVGKMVRLKDVDDPAGWWIVKSVPDKGIEEKYLQELKTAYRKQREASDI